MSATKGYATELIYNDDAVKYLFVSRVKKDIVKAIQYHYVQNFLNRRLYNLGFGDYNISKNEIADDTDSNNGDIYLVFYTVLNTIPKFFKLFPDAMLIVRGSDSTPEFEADCRKNCVRNCIELCKKLNRRINAYRDYVNKNFEHLMEDYIFYGALDAGNQRIIKYYEKSKEYNAVFLCKR